MFPVVRSGGALAVSALLALAAVAACSTDNMAGASGQDGSVGEDSAATGHLGSSGSSSGSGGDSGKTCLSGTASQCFTASSVTCTGLGTDACHCSAKCGEMPFTWSCGATESCTAGTCASNCDVGCGGSACVAKCATLQAAATEMQASVGGCGVFFGSSSPFQSCQCAAGIDAGGSSSGGTGFLDGANGALDVGSATADGASDVSNGETGTMDASMADASEAGSDGSGNDSASNDSGPSDAETTEGTDGPVDAAGDAPSCTAGTAGGPPGSCQQIRTCGSNVYVANCTPQGTGTCAANGLATSTTYRCECGTPPTFLSTNGYSCAVLDADGGLESIDCLGACGF